jgi:multidrug efflux pump subunit AcrA (membrane-fusion protein)
LINAGSSGQELFEVSDLRRLRIYVQVPQTLASKLTVGQDTAFTLPEAPGQVLHARIAAISHALDTGTRTMLVQLQADNPGLAIGAGSYCQVAFHVSATGLACACPQRLW